MPWSSRLLRSMKRATFRIRMSSAVRRSSTLPRNCAERFVARTRRRSKRPSLSSNGLVSTFRKLLMSSLYLSPNSSPRWSMCSRACSTQALASSIILSHWSATTTIRLEGMVLAFADRGLTCFSTLSMLLEASSTGKAAAFAFCCSSTFSLVRAFSFSSRSCLRFASLSSSRAVPMAAFSRWNCSILTPRSPSGTMSLKILSSVCSCTVYLRSRFAQVTISFLLSASLVPYLKKMPCISRVFCQASAHLRACTFACWILFEAASTWFFAAADRLPSFCRFCLDSRSLTSQAFALMRSEHAATAFFASALVDCMASIASSTSMTVVSPLSLSGFMPSSSLCRAASAVSTRPSSSRTICLEASFFSCSCARFSIRRARFCSSLWLSSCS
mmetsp:Transcript_96443/g.287806  ORF Transcript_96443/g.287806 Transcript_96443/m.287806 type:complete len:387 (-) Transcript_96443:843-2003(-)